jgi:McKusick-Kaufman syndrome protein
MMSFSEDAIKEFRHVVATCYGPLGRVALLQPVAGGHVTITCQSSKIFQLLKSSNLLIQLLYASLINHSLEYRDGTKTAAILTSNIILNTLHLDHPKRQIANVIDHLLERGIEYIEKSCHIPLDWSSIHQLMDVTRSLISPHSLLNYNQQELDHLSSLILQVKFLINH